MAANRGFDPAEMESRELRRQLRRTKRRRSDRMLLLLMVLGPACLYFAYELGRSVFCMQGVGVFISTLDTHSSKEIKADLDRYADQLHDHNALVRNSAMAAFKAATGWNLGADREAWYQYWREQRPYWEYHRSTEHAPAPTTPAWVSNLPPSVLQSALPPPKAEAPAQP